MKSAVVATIVTVILMALLGISFLSFFSGYNDNTVSLKTVLADGMMLLSTLITIVIFAQIFIIWVFSNQVTKLKNHLDNQTNVIDSLETRVKLLRDDINLLM